MNNIANIVFIYDTKADICFLKAGKAIRELTIKGACDYQGVINGTWFQIAELVSHWISFRKDKFQANKWEVFYKRIDNEQITYYRKVFYQVERFLTFAFSERDEWVKDPLSGRWKSKFN